MAAKKAVKRSKGKARLEPARVKPAQLMVISEDSSESESYSSEEDVMEDVMEDRVFGSIPSVPNTSHVSDKVKRKIAGGKYFAIKKLLPTLDDDIDEEEEKKMTYQQWATVEDRRRSGDSRRSKDLTMLDWMRCFHTFMSLRLQTAPLEVQGMLRHAEIVQDLYSMGKDAVKYDALFRRTKDQHPSICWGEYMAEIVIKLPMRVRFGQFPQYRSAMQGQVRTGQNSGFTRTGQNSGFNRNGQYGQRSCLRFNSMVGCHMPNCLYVHKCGHCGRIGHPTQRCFLKKRQN